MFSSFGNPNAREHGPELAKEGRRASQQVEGVVSDPLSESEEARRQEAELAAAILEYLAERPAAMDTIRGISEWWFLNQQPAVDLAILSRVLKELEQQGHLERIGSGDEARYRLRTNV